MGRKRWGAWAEVVDSVGTALEDLDDSNERRRGFDMDDWLSEARIRRGRDLLFWRLLLVLPGDAGISPVVVVARASAGVAGGGVAAVVVMRGNCGLDL